MSKIKYPQYRLLQDMSFGPFSFKTNDVLTIGRTETGDNGLNKNGEPVVNKKTGQPLKSSLRDWYHFAIPNRKNRWYTIPQSVFFDKEVFTPLYVI